MWKITFQTSMAISCKKILAQIFLKERRLIVLASNLSLIRRPLKLWTSCLKTLALSLSIKLVLILFLLKLTLVLRLKFLPLIKTVCALLIKLILLFRLSLSLLILVLELRLNVIVRSLHFYWCLWLLLRGVSLDEALILSLELSSLDFILWIRDISSLAFYYT